jgi:hypothetical protein
LQVEKTTSPKEKKHAVNSNTDGNRRSTFC